jgi:fructokinase
MNYDVTALGELLIDFTPSGVNDQGVGLFSRNPGGALANVLAMNNKLVGSHDLLDLINPQASG